MILYSWIKSPRTVLMLSLVFVLQALQQLCCPLLNFFYQVIVLLQVRVPDPYCIVQMRPNWYKSLKESKFKFLKVFLIIPKILFALWFTSWLTWSAHFKAFNVITLKSFSFHIKNIYDCLTVNSIFPIYSTCINVGAWQINKVRGGVAWHNSWKVWLR